jgi:hypothetical protein
LWFLFGASVLSLIIAMNVVPAIFELEGILDLQ